MSQAKFEFGTKAETLSRLQPALRGANILPLAYITRSDWISDPSNALASITELLGTPLPSLVVRSSAKSEDGETASMAGQFESLINVDGSNSTKLRNAIERVFASMPNEPEDQVLIQPFAGHMAASGVIHTHALNSGAPYYVISYDDETGRTDTVTSGTGTAKTLHIFRDGDASPSSTRIRRLLSLAREIEARVGDVYLDIEFGLTEHGQLIVFQVRRIASRHRWAETVADEVAERLHRLDSEVQKLLSPDNGLAGHKGMLGLMPDWNPAELLGSVTKPLSFSIFDDQISSSTWREARHPLGYRRLPERKLVHCLAQHPYVDVRASFNSLLPAQLDTPATALLVDTWLDRLGAYPELHDKVEFKVAQTCCDFEFDQNWKDWYGGTLTSNLREDLKSALIPITEIGLDYRRGSSLFKLIAAFQSVTAHTPKPDHDEQPSQHLSRLLSFSRVKAALPFATVARHAFIAESILRSAVTRGALLPERLNLFRRANPSVATELAQSFFEVFNGTLNPDVFLARYGHLRPGTFDITSQRYDQRQDLFEVTKLVQPEASPKFELSQQECLALNQLLSEAGVRLNAQEVMRAAAAAIVGREKGKFILSKLISDSLEAIASLAKGWDIERPDAAFLTLDSLLGKTPDITKMTEEIAQAKEAFRVGGYVKLPQLLTGRADLQIAPMHRSEPTFTSVKSVRAQGVPIFSDQSMRSTELTGKIALIESADPGFDWILSRGISGLVTKYGGANSHMSVRCAELDLPAAIGCGEALFQRLLDADAIELDAELRVLRPLTRGFA